MAISEAGLGAIRGTSARPVVVGSDDGDAIVRAVAARRVPFAHARADRARSEGGAVAVGSNPNAELSGSAR